MPRKIIPLPDWIPQACELMVKYDLSLRQAAAELGQDISIEEADADIAMVSNFSHWRSMLRYFLPPSELPFLPKL
jgi:hypothetical protein